MAPTMRARPIDSTDRPPASRRAYFLETVLFLLVLLPWMGLALVGTSPHDLSFTLVAATVILHDLVLTALAVYLLRRRGEGVATIGWTGRGAGREALIGVALFVPLFIGVALLQGALRGAGLAEPVGPPSYLVPVSGTDYLLALVLLAVVAVAEETVFRGYLIRRFNQVTGSVRFAVILSSLIFALGHAYQGPIAIVATGAIGVAFAAVYLRRGSLVAPTVMHFIQNFLGLIIAPRFLA